MSLTRNTISLGDFKLHFLDDGIMYIDGGAMFGALPKIVWQKLTPPDELNRVQLALRPLLVQTPTELILIETGAGNGRKEKLKKMFGVERRVTLEESLKEAGFRADDVTIVVNTHLHFDHAGGNLVESAGSALVPAFPRARYVIHEESWREATNLHERTRTTIMADDFLPLREAGVLDPVTGTSQIAPGVTIEPHRGHLDCVACVRLESRGQTAFFASDVIPDSFHIPPAYIAAIDLHPMAALADKKSILRSAASENWLLLFYHDPTMLAARVKEEGEKYVVLERT